LSTDDAPGDQDLQELRQAASAIVALARVLSLPTTAESDRRRIVESIERTARTMLLRLGAPPPDPVDSPDAAPLA
jgi:hypothetical protein